MNKPPKITYLLGAGASYNALPVIDELPDVAECMIGFIESRITKKYGPNSYDRPKLDKTRLLINEVRKHHSIDTLARKIWIKNSKFRSERIFDEEYNRIKNLITAILYFKQINIGVDYKDIDVCKLILPKRKSGNNLNIDPRYEAFFAAVLNEDFTIPENFNFISWNYDFQIEKTLQYYHDKATIKNVGNEYGIHYINYVNTKSICQILKLNGTSLFVNESKVVDSVYYEDEMDDIFLNGLSDDVGKLKTVHSLIKFAWENISEIKSHHAIAAKKIEESDFVVVIGYSFPIFNRQVDIDLFKNFRLSNTKIIIQAPESDVNQYIEQLESIKSGLSKKATSITNLDQFYIPNEFWTQKPNSYGGYALIS